MLKSVILLISVGLVWSMEDKNIVDGSWRVLNIKKCEDSEKYPIQLDVRRRKCNRTTDCFDGEFKLNECIDETFSLRCFTCKHCDGGCKKYTELYDPVFISFCERYADANIKKALEMMGVNPPRLPMCNGQYTIRNYVFNYCELPKSGPEGSFSVDCFIYKNEEARGCIHVDLMFREELDVCD